MQPAELSNVVNDVAWSPFHPQVFASVTGDGMVYVWDLSRSLLEPILAVQCDQGQGNSTKTNNRQPSQESGESGPAAYNKGSTRASGLSGDSNNDENNRNVMNHELLGRKESTGSNLASRDTDRSSSPSRPGTASQRRGSTNGPSRRPTVLRRSVQLTSISFSETCPVFATGSTSGVVEVYKLSGLGQRVSKAEGAERLKAILYPKGER